ncbi:MAG: TetR/AcrR family transcriptional regulator [Acidobacteriia bacterium]|nr:TetR/AcrR family transcriptional regulator [Terriglobia bacterium]
MTMKRDLSPLAVPSGTSRDRILSAAKALFASKGFESTSTVAIARLAGTSESQLVKHFHNKEGLLEAIFDSAWQKLMWTVGQAGSSLPSPHLKLLSLVETALAALDRDPEVKFLMLLEGRRPRKDGQRVGLDHGFMEFVKRIDQILMEMLNAGQLRKDLSIQVVRSALLGATEGLLRDQLIAKRMEYPAKYNASEVRQAFNVLLSAFMTPSNNGRKKPSRT